MFGKEDTVVASTQKSILTANERRYLVERSLQCSELRAEDIAHAIAKYRDERKRQKAARLERCRYEYIRGEKAAPLAGCLKGQYFNRYVRDLVTSEPEVVIHTILLPEDRSRYQVVFYDEKVLDTKRYQLKPGEIPRTACAPSRHFEAFVDADATSGKYKMPKHFIVADSELAAPCTERVIKEEYEAKFKHQLQKDRETLRGATRVK